MKLKDLSEIPQLPGDMDIECIALCHMLNRLPGIKTMESCCGHGKDIYSVWFNCNNIETLSRLGRCIEKNYSDGNWEIVVDSCDTNPFGLFWLRSKNILTDLTSVLKLIENIIYWFDDKFDEYFKNPDKD
jgi:hypothetical protein